MPCSPITFTALSISAGSRPAARAASSIASWRWGHVLGCQVPTAEGGQPAICKPACEPQHPAPYAPSQGPPGGLAAGRDERP